MHTLLTKQLALLKIDADTSPSAEKWAELLAEISSAYTGLFATPPEPATEKPNDELRHDLKNVLASIRGFAEEMLRDQTLPHEQRTEFLNIIVTESDKLFTLIDHHIH